MVQKGLVISSEGAAAGGLSLQHNFAWTLVGNLIFAACQFLMLIVIAKGGTPADVGHFALGLAITSPVMIFANQGLRALQATDAEQRWGFGDYLGYRFATSAVALVLICSITEVFRYPPIVIVIGVAKAIESVGDVIYGLYQQTDHMNYTATSMILKGILSVVSLTVLLHVTHLISWAAMGIAIASTTVLATYDCRKLVSLRAAAQESFSAVSSWWQSLSPAFAPNTFTELANVALPLGIAQTLISITVNVPRYFVEHRSGTAALGIYAAITYLMTAGTMIATALAQSSSARLSRLYFHRELSEFRALILRLMLVGGIFGSAGIIVSASFGSSLLRVVYRPEYARYSHLLLIAMTASAINYFAVFAGTSLTAVRVIRVMPFIYAACACVCVCASALLVPRLGVIGAGWAVLISEGFHAAITLTTLNWAYRREVR